MGAWAHRIVKDSAGASVCVCGSSTILKAGIPRCKYAQRRQYHGTSHNRNAAYRIFRGMRCERCHFVPENDADGKPITKQLDVHHKDGNHENNDPLNLQTLCANCHRVVHDRWPGKKKTPKPYVDTATFLGKTAKPSGRSTQARAKAG